MALGIAFVWLMLAYRLMPENDFIEPIEVKDAKILGKVIGIVRKYF